MKMRAGTLNLKNGSRPRLAALGSPRTHSPSVHRLGATIAAACGALDIVRGATGFCPGYAAAGIDTQAQRYAAAAWWDREARRSKPP